jgi:F420-0:gamma-glutamyl ligase-like protein
MTKYKVLPIVTKYWRPGENYLQEIVKKVEQKIADRDIVVVSEKAISTATNNIVDESKVQPSLSARLIAEFWMRTVWGYSLGILCRFRHRLLQQLRTYPSTAGSRHKQVVLQNAGFLEALMFGSEGGIDGSNLPYSYVSLPLRNAPAIAEKIRKEIELKLAKKVAVIIADTDKTYVFGNFHFTHRPTPIKGIHSHGGFIAYVVGRTLNLKRCSTPLAVAGRKFPVERALKIAELANRSRGFGAGRTVWEMANRFKVQLAGVTWEMLDTVKHKPIVVLRSNK